MAFPVTINGRTYTLADFEGTNYVDGFPDALEDFVTQAGDIYNSTSTSSVTIGTGSKSFTTADSGKPYQAGTPLRIADSANPETNFMDCIVTSYSGTSLVVDAFGYAGSGTISSWTINIGGAKTVDGTLAVAQGGTGATTAAAARTNLDVYSKTEADNKFLDVSGEASNVTINGTTTMNGDVTIGDTSGDSLTVNATVDINAGSIDGTTIGGTTPAAGTFTTVTADGLTVDTNTLHVDSTNNRVGIGTSSPSRQLHISGSGANTRVRVQNTTGGSQAELYCDDSGNTQIVFGAGKNLIFDQSGSERMRIDANNNLLIGKTSAGASTDGFEVNRAGTGYFVSTGAGIVGYLNRTTTDGDILELRKDNTAIGSLGVDNSVGVRLPYLGSNGFSTLWANAALLPANGSGAVTDNAYDIGASGYRWDDIFATNGTIQTSDANEKQDIEELSEAEQRVAQACRGLLRKFRWKDAVEKKGDDARIHFGIIAQDLQAAFEAEGLDAGRYAMFIYSEWWETYTDVPAVEAQDAVYETVTDEEGNETQVLVSEAVEAKAAYTRTDTYDTAEEAPEGAVERTRLGVRYSELLAFIISAI